MLLVGLIYLLPKVFSVDSGGDFRILWIAGSVWHSGGDPYTTAFITRYLEAFGPPHPDTHLLVYPPHWFGICVLLDLLPFKVAFVVWRMLSLAALAGGTWLCALSLDREKQIPPLLLFLIALSLICFTQAAAIAIALGQTPMILLLSAGLMLFGLSRENRVALVAGLLLGSLKPNFGLVLFAIVLASGRWRSAAMAFGIACIACLPAFITSGLRETITHVAQSIASYSSLDVNSPPELTGLSHLYHLASGQTLGAPLLSAVAAGIAAALCWRRSGDEMLQRSVLAISLALVLVPLHSYDLMLLVIPAMWAMGTSRPARWLVFVGELLTLRAGNLGDYSGFKNAASVVFRGSLIESLAVILVATGCLWLAFAKSDRRTNLMLADTD